ncbi:MULTISPECIES: cytochrome c oxidase assembly protein [unclassified Massilia]|uniref:cytochrome c oxidase assembly protein n=1 Tax=unclassified Massilia TaxID=2609279 RepID=UPI00177A81A3|nr:MULTISPECIES: cytochrome c oxidase assembly protein [unclassified Massilia]MBD8530725.1 cytochrome c oxidase assembly protein [Massilia sp. CFBP 13647]MBD8676451.1 cytochrome c oxidase assembly protein [Massilia sp. CFBP 13721]
MHLIGFVLLLLAGAARAHDVAAPVPPPLGWTFEPWVVLCLGLSALLYGLGLARLWKKSGEGRARLRLQAWSFGAGWLALAAALVSPIDAMGTLLFSAHMLQHEAMMIVAAPLLVLGRPFALWMWGLPPRWRRPVGAAVRVRAVHAAWTLLTWPLFAWLLHAAVLWLWHAPLFFEAALHSNAIHTLQHVSFLGSALLFWWAVLGIGTFRPQRGLSMLYIFTTMAHTGALGALLTWSGIVWYPSYIGAGEAFGMDALEDQQLGGLIMWVPGGLAYLIAGLALVAKWLGHTPAAGPDAASGPGRIV